MEERSAFQEAILTQGIEVGKLAQSFPLFNNGVLISEDYRNLSGAIEHTQQAIADNVPAIFEATFIFDNVLIRVDILKKNDDDTYDLIEVKSGTSVKKEHLPDCAVQLYVLQGLGFKINRVCIMYLNNKYVRRGELDVSQLFVVEPVNEKIENELAKVPYYLVQINNVLSKAEEPFWQIGSICNNPYQCEFKNYCWQQIEKNSVHYIARISDAQRQELIESDINLTRDVPENFKLSESQKIQVDCEKNQKPFIDKTTIFDFLSKLQYPLYFLDFETVGYAIPQYDGVRPYQHLPFQYSLHVKRQAGSELEHYEFLFDKKENPTRVLAEELVRNIGNTGSVIVYYAPFEGSRLKEMINSFPDLALRLQSIYDRLWDLQIPFAKRWYCDPVFYGSASIKNVLPVLVPDLTYTDLEIQKGDVAQFKYLQLISEVSNEVRQLTKKALLQYCGLDTMAMVRILDFLHSSVK